MNPVTGSAVPPGGKPALITRAGSGLAANLDAHKAGAVAARLRAATGGHIINIAFSAAKRAWPDASAYASTWGLPGLSQPLHAERRRHRIKVTAVTARSRRTAFLLDRCPDLDQEVPQGARDVARAIAALLRLPPGSVVAEPSVLPMRARSWP